MSFITGRFKAYIFDMDGVLTDTVHYHYLSWKQLAEEENIPFTKKDNQNLLGLSREDSLQLFLGGRQISETERKSLLERKNRYFLDLITNFSEKDLIPGVYELILKLKKLKYKLAVASSSKNANPILEKLGIKSFFEFITDGSEVSQAKPAPDLFLLTAAKLNENPEDCIVIEDSAAGIEAALAAKMHVVGIGPAELVGKAHFRFSTMKEFNLETLWDIEPN